ncbi:putative membrane spanning protein [Borrelia duttonii CR2A]|uniref:Putative membrane spanning protein n=1 Tax=Borrelia duttonii CR2A TaxID=1432657 RepID=W6THE8_9SPIR|nr:virulence associated lipoprotein [Borrelia duttonii]ETZ17888.1 putative membrane spanning protein [Borrelia duttonii CR2A]
MGRYFDYYSSLYYRNIFDSIDKVFNKVPYKVDDNGKELVYGGVKVSGRVEDKTTASARDEVLLAFGYSNGFTRAFGVFASKLVATPALLAKNKVKLKDLLIKIRKCAKAYYVDAYDTLQNNLSNLESLSAAEVKSLHDNLALLKAEREKLVSKILQPLKNKYPIIEEYLIEEYLANSDSEILANITADEIETYWNTLSAEFDSICNEIMMISGEIKGILDRFEVKG